MQYLFSLAAAKGQYISQAGLHRFAMFEVEGDYNCLLVNALDEAML